MSAPPLAPQSQAESASGAPTGTVAAPAPEHHAEPSMMHPSGPTMPAYYTPSYTGGPMFVPTASGSLAYAPLSGGGHAMSASAYSSQMMTSQQVPQFSTLVCNSSLSYDAMLIGEIRIWAIPRSRGPYFHIVIPFPPRLPIYFA
jgi:hypothetical protein